MQCQCHAAKDRVITHLGKPDETTVPTTGRRTTAVSRLCKTDAKVPGVPLAMAWPGTANGAASANGLTTVRTVKARVAVRIWKAGRSCVIESWGWLARERLSDVMVQMVGGAPC